MSVRNLILKRIETTALGARDTRDIADLCCDVLNSIQATNKEVAAETNLSEATVNRVRANIKPYNPNTRTVEKILRTYNIKVKLI